jgi:hypothetical protein
LQLAINQQSDATSCSEGEHQFSPMTSTTPESGESGIVHHAHVVLCSITEDAFKGETAPLGVDGRVGG